MSHTFKKMALLSFLVAAGTVSFAQQKGVVGGALAASIERNEGTNLPKIISFSPTENYTLDRAQDVFSKYLDLGPSSVLKLVSTETPPEGLTVQRYAQWYQGVKVENSAVTIAAKNGVITLLRANVYKPQQTLAITPAITETSALNSALKFVGAKKYMWQNLKMESILKQTTKNNDTSYYPKGTLVWIEARDNDKRDGQLHLAYCFNIYAQQPLSRDLIYVDAQTGKVIFKNALMKHTAAIGTSLYSGSVTFETAYDSTASKYALHDLTRGNGIYTFSVQNRWDDSVITDIVNPTTSWTSPQPGIDAHWGAKNVYDYWHNIQNRWSIDNNGMPIYSFVNLGTDFDNAFWDGSEMNYGDGSGITNGGFSPLTSMDVCAHEMGHGICQYTANLDYQGESGAMNESLSDIWGAVIENWSNPHEVDAQPKETWEIGEEVGSTPLRSMDQPKLHDQPDTYHGANWANTSSYADYGGVHTNSGVGNHWFYLLSQGGSGVNDQNNSFYLNGIGITKAAKIVYQTEQMMTSYDQYIDFRNTSIAVATALYGSCSAEVEAVTRAWYAVGVGNNFVPCTPQLSFGNLMTKINENANSATCPASKTINIPLTAEGPAITGGTATVTVSVVNPGNAVNGVDYTLSNATLSFGSSSAATQYAHLTVYDNGSVDTNRSFVLGYTITANGSNLTAGILKRDSIVIVNDDHAPEPGGDESHIVGIGIADTSNYASPFLSGAQTARTQYIITAAEMTAAGMRANVPIKSMAFDVVQKNSTVPFQDYTVKMNHVPSMLMGYLMWNFIPSPFTTVYSGNYTTAAGWNTINFTNNFIWDGVSDVGVEICFANANSDTANDQVAGVVTSSTVTAASFGSGYDACSLVFSGYSTRARPLIKFVQAVPPVTIETAVNSNRSWDVHTGQRTYFYSSSDNELIADIDNVSSNIGCTAATMSKAGSGFFTTAIGGATINRSLKEFTLTPTTGNTAGYTGTFYFNNAEFNGTPAGSIWLVKTSAATDAGINAQNTSVIMPTLVHGLDYTGFQGNFTGFGRYFLTDKNLPLGVSNPEITTSGIQVKNNPFNNVIHIGYNYQSDDNAKISLTDISGKALYKAEQHMNAGGNGFDIDLSQLTLTPGYYILQITTSKEVFVHKMLHD